MSENNQQQLENEDELVEKAKTDDAAFGVLYNYYLPRVFGYLYKRTGSKEVTEDLVSTTFMDVFCNLNRYEKRASFRSWLFRIATNNLIDYYRKENKKKNVDIEAIQEPEATGMQPADLAESAQNKEVVQRIINDLPEKDQRILSLKFFAELSNIEIAETLKISTSNAGVMIHRALKKFQQSYNQYEKQYKK